MSKECSKALMRRLSNPNFMRLYFKGEGLDVGGKPDPLVLYTELFPLVTKIRTWDLEDGDAQFLNSVGNETYDFVHSSHCLEHLNDPFNGLHNWLRVLKPGGYLIITVPDEDLYEQGQFPSVFNEDHKWTFTIWKPSLYEHSINIIELVQRNDCTVEKIELLNSTYRTLPMYDQTLTPIGECGIEVILRKKPLVRRPVLLSKEMKIYLNQYKDDQKIMKKNNIKNPPFKNENDI